MEFTESAFGCLFVVLIILCLPLVAFSLYRLHVAWSPLLPGSIHVVRGAVYISAFPALFANCVIAHWASMLIGRLVMRQRSQRYESWGYSRHPNLKFTSTAVNWLGIGFVTISILFTIAISNPYAAFFEDHIEIRELLDRHARTYSYQDVNNVTVWQTEREDSDTKSGHIVIHFADGRSWDGSGFPWEVTGKRAVSLGDFVAAKSGIVIGAEQSLP